MGLVLGGVLAALTLMLLVAGLLGMSEARARARGAVVEPRRDLSARTAYDEDNEGRPR